MSDNKQRALAEAARLERKYGLKSGSVGAETFKLNAVPTGSLALDVALGIGGWPLGHPVEVFGPPDIGKSSVIALNAIRNAQADGLLCGVIALEPGWDGAWAAKAGVDTKEVIIARPNTGEEAFEILHEWVADDLADFVVFDSIGAIVTQGERDQDKVKSVVGGQAKLITDGVKRILTPAWKNNKGVILLNQIRDQMSSPIPGQVESPGGRNLKHTCAIRVELKPVGPAFKEKVEGADEPVVVGRRLKAIIKRNKLSEGSDKRAEFDYYQMESADRPIGIDWADDVISTAIRMRVIEKAGGYYRHSTFGEKDQLQGRPAVEAFLAEDPDALKQIRTEVLAEMLLRQQKK